MKVLIVGATGMVGKGVLRECLQATDVELTVTVVAPPPGSSTQGCAKSCMPIWRICSPSRPN